MPLGELAGEGVDEDELLQAVSTSPAVATATSGQARSARATDPVFNMIRQ